MILTVPNLLTFSRMLLTPYLGYLVVAESYTMACVVFTVAGVTDLVISHFVLSFISRFPWLSHDQYQLLLQLKNMFFFGHFPFTVFTFSCPGGLAVMPGVQTKPP